MSVRKGVPPRPTPPHAPATTNAPTPKAVTTPKQPVTPLAARPPATAPKVLQPKIRSAPPAPPVYRPSLKKVVQRKTSALASAPKSPPSAPPVYRPQPAPKVLQRKTALPQPHAVGAPRRPVAPPVYRPARPSVAQPKMAHARPHTPPPPPAYRPGAPVIQRKVLSRKNKKGATVYYTDQDPKKDFDTREEAEIHELSLGLSRVDEGSRGPTLYQFTHTKSHCQISSLGVGQGPHSMGFAAVHSGLEYARERQNIRVIFSEQVPSPEDWQRIVITEKGKEAFNGKSEFSRRLVRALQEYTALYKQTELLIKLGSEDAALKNISRLMQLGPYTTYGWKSQAKASHKSLSGKGEDDDIMLDSNIDKGGKWKDKEAYKMFVEDRRSLMDDDYVDEDRDELDYDRVRYDGPALYFAHDEIDNGGDCFFDTLHALGIGTGSTVQQLRQLAADNGGQHNIASIIGPRVWANHQDITALANHFGVRIRVLSLSIWDNSINQDTTYGAAGPVHLIAQIHGGHFTPLYNQPPKG